MVTNNLQYYDTLLQAGRPLFTVEVLLSPPEIVLHPHANELLKVMNQAMMEVVEGYASVWFNCVAETLLKYDLWCHCLHHTPTAPRSFLGG